MRSFSEENYRNIQSLFTEKTGVPLRKRRAARAAPFVLAAAVLAIIALFIGAGSFLTTTHSVDGLTVTSKTS